MESIDTRCGDSYMTVDEARGFLELYEEGIISRDVLMSYMPISINYNTLLDRCSEEQKIFQQEYYYLDEPIESRFDILDL